MNFGASKNGLLDDNSRSDTADWLKNNVGSLRV
jgi:hypothetical protein